MNTPLPDGPLETVTRIDAKLIRWMDRHGRTILRWALAVIFIWFGGLKVFAASPADDLVRRTVYWFSPDVFLPILGVWEVVIGVCLLVPVLMRVGLLLLFFQLPGTFLPLVLLPEVCFIRFPFALTMEGQYIFKNLLIIGAALVVGGSMHTLRSSLARGELGGLLGSAPDETAAKRPGGAHELKSLK